MRASLHGFIVERQTGDNLDTLQSRQNVFAVFVVRAIGDSLKADPRYGPPLRAKVAARS